MVKTIGKDWIYYALFFAFLIGLFFVSLRLFETIFAVANPINISLISCTEYIYWLHRSGIDFTRRNRGLVAFIICLLIFGILTHDMVVKDNELKRKRAKEVENERKKNSYRSPFLEDSNSYKKEATRKPLMFYCEKPEAVE